MSSQNLIHPTAIIDPSAEIASDVQIGPYCIVGPNVTIDAGTKLRSHVVIGGFTKIGKNNDIFQFSSVGEICQDLKYQGEETWLEIGDNNFIREHCTLHRGTVQDNAITKIGSHNLFMVNTHIAHDCVIGDHNIFANNVGGNAGIHQFCRIDSYSMIGGAALILKDVPAYVMASGNPAHAYGMNIEGMRRKGWTRDTIQGLREAYKLIYKAGLTTEQAIEQIRSDILTKTPEAQLFIDSLEKSTRGIVR
jgi:UDP-N-acetylglucosamine acyltransferase